MTKQGNNIQQYSPINGSQYHLHATKLRKVHVRVDSVECNNTMYATPELLDQQIGNCSCAIIYEQDSDFGDVSVIDPAAISQYESLPSQRINPERLSHLNATERNELLSC